MKKYFDDFQVGQKERVGSVLVTKEDIVQFAQEFDPQPFHVDEAAAKMSIFGGLTACGAHIVALKIKLIHAQAQGKAEILAGLGWDEWRFATPVRPNDTLTLEIETVEKRESQSKPDRGIVRQQLSVLNQTNETGELSDIDNEENWKEFGW